MPSDAKKKRDAKKKEAVKAKHQQKPNNATNGSGGDKSEADGPKTYEEELVEKLERDMDINAEYRSCTGVLGVHPRSRDIKINNFSITFHGVEMLTDTTLGKL